MRPAWPGGSQQQNLPGAGVSKHFRAAVASRQAGPVMWSGEVKILPVNWTVKVVVEEDPEMGPHPHAACLLPCPRTLLPVCCPHLRPSVRARCARLLPCALLLEARSVSLVGGMSRKEQPKGRS